MNDYENMYKTICRLCLSQNNSEKMVALIDNSNELSSFGKAITIITNVLLQKDDKLPTMMCEQCIYLLKQSIYFKLKCESTDKQLRELVNQNVNSETSDRNINEIVCEYVMFNHYFPKKPMKTKKIVYKTNQKDSIEQPQTDNDSLDKTYDFDDFLDNEDNKNHTNDEKEEYSQEINNILDKIQDVINGGMETYKGVNKLKKRKLKRECGSKHTTNARNFLCNICNKVLANPLTYNHHMQRHNNCKYICDKCGKGFPVLTELSKHQVARHGVGPYLQCDHCPYKAPRKLDLIEHLRLHTGERPFTCEKCGLTFRRKAIYRNHLVHHSEKKYQCTYCPRKFFTQGSMLAHSNNVHERLYMYMCNVCNITYTKTETVKRHMLVKHGIPREKQGKVLRIMNGSSEFPGKVN